MVLRRRKIKMKKITEEVPQQKKEEKTPVETKTKMEEIADFITEKEEEKESECDQIDENNVVVAMINEKKESLLKNRREFQCLETRIKKECSEIEALEYIASGEPTMSIVDLLNMIQDFADNSDEYEDMTDMLDAMEKTILKSTMDSIRR